MSLTLTPMMCARMLSAESLLRQNRFSCASVLTPDLYHRGLRSGAGAGCSIIRLTLSVALGTCRYRAVMDRHSVLVFPAAGQRHYSVTRRPRSRCPMPGMAERIPATLPGDYERTGGAKPIPFRRGRHQSIP
ncbi:hypothetical protein WDV93_03105 [Pantoea ananatis]